MSTHRIYVPQPPEIVAALAAAGCGIIRRAQERQEAPPVAVEAEPEPTYPVGFPITLDRIIRTVSRETKISVREMLSDRRFVPVARARQIYFFAARKLTGRSLPAIGRACYGKDHSTVLHGIRKVQEQRARFEPELSRVLTRFGASFDEEQP